MDLSLTKLNYLVTVAREQSFSRAAETLHVSQPALSRAITAMERGYGVRIFDRSRSGTVPTVAGTQIISEAEELLRQANTFHQNSRMIARGERGDVSVGIGPALASSMFPNLARKLMALRPEITLEVMVRRTDVLARYLLTEAIEFFISVPENLGLPAEIETQRIGHVYGGFYVRTGHPLCGRRGLVMRDILAYPLANARQSSLRSRFDCDGGSIICDNYSLVYELMQISDTVCISTRRAAAGEVEAGRLALLEAEDYIFESSEVVVGHIAGRTMSPMANEVVDFCRDWFTGPVPMPAGDGRGAC